MLSELATAPVNRQRSTAAVNSDVDERQFAELQESMAAVVESATERHSQANFLKALNDIISTHLMEFETWTSLIAELEKTYPDNIEVISVVYEAFLTKFPLCHKYWKMYADHKVRLCNVDKVVEVYESAVQSATHSIDIWMDYCNFGIHTFADPYTVRRLFERGLSFVGKNFMCHTLWDLYIKFEFSQESWGTLAYTMIRCLEFPTKKLHDYRDHLQKIAAIIKEEIELEETFSIELDPESLHDIEYMTSEDEIFCVIKELQDPSDISLRSKALYKFLATGEQFYHKSSILEEKILGFEKKIQRPFFDVKELEGYELENWHNYLDFIEKQEDFDWAVKHYERCLIPCANYAEFWMRYVEFMESKGGREMANFALERATKIFLKDVPEMLLFKARFKEQIKDVDGARATFSQCDTDFGISFVENVIKEANMEKRLGNMAAASNIYEKALKVAAERQILHAVPSLYVHFYRLKYMITRSTDVSRDVIIDGIQHLPGCRLLLEELIKFAMTHDGASHLSKVDPIIANAIAGGQDGCQVLDSKDREELSFLYLELVDLCGTNHDIRKAWNRHIKLFPHLVRTSSSQAQPSTSSNLLLNLVIERSRGNSYVATDESSRGDCPNEFLPENLATRGDSSAVGQLNSTQNDGDICLKERVDQFTHVETMESEVNKVICDSLNQFRDGEPGKNTSKSVALIHESQYQETSSRPDESYMDTEQSVKPFSPLEKSTEPLCMINNLQERELNLDLQIRQASVCMGTQSMKPTEKLTADTKPSTHNHISPPRISIPNGKSSPTIPKQIQPADSDRKPNEVDETESVSCSTSAIAFDTRTQTHPEVDLKDDGKCPIKGMFLTSDGFDPKPDFENFKRDSASTSHTGPLLNVSQLNAASSVSQSQLSLQPGYSHPPTQLPQNPMESSGQIQQTEAYNQMLQYYYQQQQQYQQQWLGMQQSYLQQQPFYQQLIQQQQYLQQQIQLHPSQAQQLQLQLQQLYQQQVQYQQYQQGYQQYQQPQGHGQQQMLQQYQLQMQQGYQEIQQYQHLPQQQLQNVIQENQHQVTLMQNQNWYSIHSEKEQGTLAPASGTTMPSCAQSPQSQQHSP